MLTKTEFNERREALLSFHNATNDSAEFRNNLIENYNLENDEALDVVDCPHKNFVFIKIDNFDTYMCLACGNFLLIKLKTKLTQ
jgi:hypothetical protein